MYVYVCQLTLLHHLSFFLFQFPWKEIQVLPVQWHALCLGLFASIIAPFGGFFASGFKRAFKIKVSIVVYFFDITRTFLISLPFHNHISILLQDFGDSIPGHGGMTDRMDCQVILIIFICCKYNYTIDF